MLKGISPLPAGLVFVQECRQLETRGDSRYMRTTFFFLQKKQKKMSSFALQKNIPIQIS
jgi:hypothetical protein